MERRAVDIGMEVLLLLEGEALGDAGFSEKEIEIGNWLGGEAGTSG